MVLFFPLRWLSSSSSFIFFSKTFICPKGFINNNQKKYHFLISLWFTQFSYYAVSFYSHNCGKVTISCLGVRSLPLLRSHHKWGFWIPNARTQAPCHLLWVMSDSADLGTSTHRGSCREKFCLTLCCHLSHLPPVSLFTWCANCLFLSFPPEGPLLCLIHLSISNTTVLMHSDECLPLKHQLSKQNKNNFSPQCFNWFSHDHHIHN
jgi:hypothetical protein